MRHEPREEKQTRSDLASAERGCDVAALTGLATDYAYSERTPRLHEREGVAIGKRALRSSKTERGKPRSSILGTGLGDRFKGSQGRSGSFEERDKEAKRTAYIQGERGGRRPSSDPPPKP